MRGIICLIVILSVLSAVQCYYIRPKAIVKRFSQQFSGSSIRKDEGSGTRLFAMNPDERYYSKDWLRNLLSIPKSRMLKRVFPNVVVQTLWTALWCVAHEYGHIPLLNFPSVVHAILGSALGLLLVFRTNMSYDRWWEVCLKQHLQGDRINEELEPFLEKNQWNDELSEVQAGRNRPNLILRKLTETLKAGTRENYPSVTDATLVENIFEERIQVLSACASGAERLNLQPIPLAYSRHTSRFLDLYSLLLPFMLIPMMHYWTIPTVTFMKWSYVTISEIGHFIELPFDKTTQQIPLNRICMDMRSHITEMIGIPLDGTKVEIMAEKAKTEFGRK